MKLREVATENVLRFIRWLLIWMLSSWFNVNKIILLVSTKAKLSTLPSGCQGGDAQCRLEFSRFLKFEKVWSWIYPGYTYGVGWGQGPHNIPFEYSRFSWSTKGTDLLLINCFVALLNIWRCHEFYDTNFLILLNILVNHYNMFN